MPGAGGSEIVGSNDTSQRKSDLALAAELQAALLPKAAPDDCPNHTAAARNRMCSGVGGDFHDFVRINRDQIAVVIGDVVGHGVRASLVMAQIMGLLRTGDQRLSRPAQVMTTLNKMLIDLGDRIGEVVNCSLLYGVIDTPTGAGFFANAGHPRPLVCNRDTGAAAALGRPDILLGIEPFEPAELCHTFPRGQRLVMFTDGITEAMDPSEELFGDRRLRDVIEANTLATPDECADAVLQAVDDFRSQGPPTDDETIVVIDHI